MLRYRRLAHVALDVVDPRTSAAALRALAPLGMACIDGGPDGARFDVGGGAVLTLHRAPEAGLRSFAFELESAPMLERLRRALDSAAIAHERMPGGLRMREPHSQAQVEFRIPAEPVAAPVNPVAGLGHVVFAVPAFREAVRFWREVLGFALSDEIDGRVALLRCFPHPAHHSLGIASAPAPRFHHLNIRVRQDRDVDEAAALLASAGVPIASGPGTHAPSGSRFVYFFDPDGLTLEVSTNVEWFEEGRERPARVLPDVPGSFARDGVTRHPRMYARGAIGR